MPQQPQPIQQFIQAVTRAAVAHGFTGFVVAVRDQQGQDFVFCSKGAVAELRGVLAEKLGLDDEATEAAWPNT